MQKPIRRIRQRFARPPEPQRPLTGSIRLNVISSRIASSICQILCRRSPAVHEFLLVFAGRSQIRTQFVDNIIIEAQVGSRKSLFQDCHPCEQAHRLPLDFIRRRQQNLPVSLEKRSRDPAHHVLGESNRSVLERDLNGRPVQRRAAHLIHPRRIKPHLPQLQIERLRWFLPAGSEPTARTAQNRQPPAKYAATEELVSTIVPSSRGLLRPPLLECA